MREDAQRLEDAGLIRKRCFRCFGKFDVCIGSLGGNNAGKETAWGPCWESPGIVFFKLWFGDT